MKTITIRTLTITFFCVFTFFVLESKAQQITITNADIESTSFFAQDSGNGNKWSIDGFYVNEVVTGIFDQPNSGLDSGSGVDGSQAFKLEIQNSTGASADVSLMQDKVDISTTGNGTYKFSFYTKSATEPSQRPFWVTVTAFDSSNTNVSNDVLTKVDNGGTVVKNGMSTGYIEQSVTVNIAANSGGGADAETLKLNIQSAKENNTYYFDNFKLEFTGATASVNLNTIEEARVFPSPFVNELNVAMLEGVAFSIFNTQGAQVFSATKNHLDIINTSNLVSGIYVLKTENGQQLKLIK